MLESLLNDPVMFLTLAAALLATGAVAGLLAGLLGVGGGIVIVPALFFMFPYLGVEDSVRMYLAVGTSLATIIPTSIMSARAHYRHGAIDVRVLKMWGPSICAGVAVGTLVGTSLKGEVLTVIFATIALLVAVRLTVAKAGEALPTGDTPATEGALPSGPVRYVQALAVGFFSVVMGIGGGSFSVPILTAYKYPIRRAVGTASAIGLIIALPGAVLFVISGLANPDLPPGSLGYVHWLGFMLIVPATMTTAPFGARLAHSVNPGNLRRAFAVFLALTSMRMFYSVLLG